MRAPVRAEASRMGFSRRRADRRVADYLRTIGTSPGFEWRLLSFAFFFSAMYMREGWRTALPVAGAVVLMFPLGFLWWRRWGPDPPPVAIGIRARGGTRAHPLSRPLTVLTIALTLLLTAALLGSAAGVTAASYVALIAATLLFAVLPVFVALLFAREDRPRFVRRGRRR
jgi:hypothetical protein